ALIWRALCFLAVVSGALPVALAQRGQPPPPLLQTGKADPAEARAALEQMRRLGIAGDYFLQFQLRIMPRRGPERTIPGQLWGTRNETGLVNRVSLALPGTGNGADALRRRLLIQNGVRSAAWRWDEGAGVAMLNVSALFEPLVPEAELTAFDLQMPFLYWNDFAYQGIVRFRGRPAHVLVMRPPADFAARYPQLSGVRVHLDTQFNALVQTELLGADGRVSKTLSVVDLKKVGEQWIVKTIDVRDEATRNKTRFSVTGAALGLDFSSRLFEPARLADDIPPPSATDILPIEP
ncbi:MAG TPA: outer membrane lipoprotein-sorting protein, partial [Opitutus sp.]|nr:outer membrane lipoprotein-sorting protein [Opitutus sp.]